MLPSSVPPLTRWSEVGEQAIEPCVIDIVKMLLPSEGLPPSRSQLFGVSAVVYNLCRNGKSKAVLPGHELIVILLRLRNPLEENPRLR